jgi:hypothetical protein
MAAIARIDSHDSNLCRASSDALDNDHLPHVSHSKPVSTPILDDAAEIEAALYSPSVTAKIWGVASGQLGNVSRYPFTPSIASALTRLPGLPPGRNTRIHPPRRKRVCLHRRQLLDLRLLPRLHLPPLQTQSKVASSHKRIRPISPPT